jgi:hypothetical protein
MRYSLAARVGSEAGGEGKLKGKLDTQRLLRKTSSTGAKPDLSTFAKQWVSGLRGKEDNGYSGGDSLPYDVLKEVATEYAGL